MARLTEPDVLATESIESRMLRQHNSLICRPDNKLVKRRFLRQNRDLIRYEKKMCQKIARVLTKTKDERGASTQDTGIGNTSFKLAYGEPVDSRYRDSPTDTSGRKQITARSG